MKTTLHAFRCSCCGGLVVGPELPRHVPRIIAWAIVQQFDLDRTWWDGIVNPPRQNQSIHAE
jgi:hypothetical protein